MPSTSLRKILFLFCFSLATQVPGITRPILDFHGWAQTLRASIARNYYENGMHFLKQQVDYYEPAYDTAPQFPLYSYLMAVLYKAFGPHDWLGRAISVFFSGLAAVFLYLLVKRFQGDSVAWVSALVFCCIPIRVYFMRAVMPEAMAIFSILAGTYFAALWSEEERSFPWNILAWFFLTLGALLKLPYLPLVFPACYLVLRRWKAKPSLIGEALLFGLFFLAAYGSWYRYAAYGLQGGRGFLHYLLGLMDVAREWTHAQYWSTVFLSRFPELCTTYAGLFFMALGLGVLGKQKEKLWVVWLATTVIYILACGQYARIHQYVVLPFAPINAVFIGAGMVWAWERWGKARPQKILLSLLFLSIPVHAYFRIHHWFDLQETWVLRAAQAADQVSQPADLFYVNAADQPFFLYHLHRKGFAGSIHQLGLVYFVKARAMGARFLFSPTGGDWAKLQPIFDAQYKRVSTDPDFVIYDMGEKKPHG